MTPAELVRLARVRRLTASGEAKEILERAQVSDNAVAQVIGVSHVTVGRWNNATRKPSGPPALAYLSLLDALCRAERAT